MREGLLKTLMENTFSRSGLVYRIGLLRELLEFVFFTKQEGKVTKELVSLFLEEKELDKDDSNFLSSLDPSFFSAFTKENFYHVLDEISEDMDKLETLSLVVPVRLEERHVTKIAKWVRSEVGPEVLLSLEEDSSIAAGCRIVWDDTLHDFSLNRYFEVHKDELHKRLSKTETPGKQNI